MKRTNSIASLVFTAVLALMLASCGDGGTNNGDAQTKEHDHRDHDHSEMDHSGDHEKADGSNLEMGENKSLTALTDHYLSTKNALVQDDAEGASAAGQKLADAASDFDLSAVEESKQAEVTEILGSIKEKGKHIANSEIEDQREHLEKMTNDMADLLSITGTDRTLYQQYCPMYKNNEGGYWISDSEEIRNPLFGSKMLKCGKVTEEL